MHIKSSKFEEINSGGLVSLGSNMEHIDTKIILSMDICSFQNQELAHIRIPSEGGEVEGCETIAVVLLIDPVCELLRIIELILCQPEQCFGTLGTIRKSTLVQESPSIRVDNLGDWQIEVVLKILY